MTDTIEKSSGNIFSDLDLDDAGEMLAKAKLASLVLDEIESRGYTQQQAAEKLGTDQSYISKLKRGDELRHFTFDRLFGWINKLDRNIILTSKSKKRNEEVATIQVTGL